jgi:hypothetical protein
MEMQKEGNCSENEGNYADVVNVFKNSANSSAGIVIASFRPVASTTRVMYRRRVGTFRFGPNKNRSLGVTQIQILKYMYNKITQVELLSPIVTRISNGDIFLVVFMKTGVTYGHAFILQKNNKFMGRELKIQIFAGSSSSNPVILLLFDNIMNRILIVKGGLIYRTLHPSPTIESIPTTCDGWMVKITPTRVAELGSFRKRSKVAVDQFGNFFHINIHGAITLEMYTVVPAIL